MNSLNVGAIVFLERPNQVHFVQSSCEDAFARLRCLCYNVGREGARVDDRGGLENRCGAMLRRGFESHPSRLPLQSGHPWKGIYCSWRGLSAARLKLAGEGKQWRGRIVWSSAHDWKSCRCNSLAGSNPALSAWSC